MPQPFTMCFDREGELVHVATPEGQPVSQYPHHLPAGNPCTRRCQRGKEGGTAAICHSWS